MMIKSDIQKLKVAKIAVIAEIMLPSMANANGNVHGGEIMKMMDSAAGCASMRYACGTTVTARVDEIIFHKPVLVGELLTCVAEVIYVGSTSLEVMVRVYSEDMSIENSSELALTAMLTMVHIDAQNRPKKVKTMEVPTDEEALELYIIGKNRYEYYKRKRIQEKEATELSFHGKQ